VVRLAVKSKGAEKPAPKGRKSKPAKDPNKPKRAPSAFFVFMYVCQTQIDPLLLPAYYFSVISGRLS
jgi:hypothetical protein